MYVGRTRKSEFLDIYVFADLNWCNFSPVRRKSTYIKILVHCIVVNFTAEVRRGDGDGDGGQPVCQGKPPLGGDPEEQQAEMVIVLLPRLMTTTLMMQKRNVVVSSMPCFCSL